MTKSNTLSQLKDFWNNLQEKVPKLKTINLEDILYIESNIKGRIRNLFY